MGQQEQCLQSNKRYYHSYLIESKYWNIRHEIRFQCVHDCQLRGKHWKLNDTIQSKEKMLNKRIRQCWSCNQVQFPEQSGCNSTLKVYHRRILKLDIPWQSRYRQASTMEVCLASIFQSRWQPMADLKGWVSQVTKGEWRDSCSIQELGRGPKSNITPLTEEILPCI